MLQLTSGGSLHGLKGLIVTLYPLKGEVMLFQETVKDCPGSLNCIVGLAGGSGSMNEREINQSLVNNLEGWLLEIQHNRAAGGSGEPVK